MNKAAMNISVTVILWICFYPEVEIAGSKRGEIMLFIRNSQSGFQRGLYTLPSYHLCVRFFFFFNK